MAEQRVAGGEAYGLFATDEKASVLSVQETDKGEHHAYSAYGHDPKLPSSLTLLGFNGEAFALVPGGYALGNGYRSFNPAMMRFISPDRLSPFGKGGEMHTAIAVAIPSTTSTQRPDEAPATSFRSDAAIGHFHHFHT
ncbi:hypothetical protein D3C79_877880 [compost metagenome]